MINCRTRCWNKYDDGFIKFIYNSCCLRNDEDNLGCIHMYIFYSYVLNVVVALTFICLGGSELLDPSCCNQARSLAALQNRQ